jgi:hypothetical protein
MRSAITVIRGGVLRTALPAVVLIGVLTAIALLPETASPARASSRTGDVSLATGAALAADRADGSPQACEAFAYAAIRQHKVVAGTPAACRGLSRAQVNQAAWSAIRAVLTRGTKSARRKQTGAAAEWVGALITYLPPAPGSPPATRPDGQPPADATGGSGPGLGVSEPAAQFAALLAWLATAASGSLVLARWLLAGGSPLRRTVAAAPPAVILAHAGAGALGLVLWAFFMLSGWAAVAWIALGMLAPVAGLGMGVLILGLPGPVRPPPGPRRGARRARIPVLTIVTHGLCAVTLLLLVLMATIGAG